MTDTEGSKFQRTPETQQALEAARRRASLQGFGPLYDSILGRLRDDPAPYDERTRRALDMTLTQLGIDVHSVLVEAKNEAWAEKHLPDSAMHVLARIAQETDSMNAKEAQKFEGENGDLTIDNSHAEAIAATLGIELKYYPPDPKYNNPPRDFWSMNFPQAAGEIQMRTDRPSGRSNMAYRRTNHGEAKIDRISAIEIDPERKSVTFIKELNGRTSSIEITKGGAATHLLPQSSTPTQSE